MLTRSARGLGNGEGEVKKKKWNFLFFSVDSPFQIFLFMSTRILHSLANCSPGARRGLSLEALDTTSPVQLLWSRPGRKRQVSLQKANLSCSKAACEGRGSDQQKHSVHSLSCALGIMPLRFKISVPVYAEVTGTISQLCGVQTWRVYYIFIYTAVHTHSKFTFIFPSW